MKIRLIILILVLGLNSMAQNGTPGTRSFDETLKLLSETENTAYFEVSKSMFEMMATMEDASPEFKDYISKLHSLKFIRPNISKAMDIKGNRLYHDFRASSGKLLPYYQVLMRKKEGGRNLEFYKREGKNINEFLLLSTDMIIYITGTLDLKHIGEFEQIMEIAGSAFDM